MSLKVKYIKLGIIRDPNFFGQGTIAIQIMFSDDRYYSKHDVDQIMAIIEKLDTNCKKVIITSDVLFDIYYDYIEHLINNLINKQYKVILKTTDDYMHQIKYLRRLFPNDPLYFVIDYSTTTKQNLTKFDNYKNFSVLKNTDVLLLQIQHAYDYEFAKYMIPKLSNFTGVRINIRTHSDSYISMPETLINDKLLKYNIGLNLKN